MNTFNEGQWDGLYGQLDIKEAAVLNRYYTLAYQMLNKKDGSKYTRPIIISSDMFFNRLATKNLIDYPKIVKTQLKMHEVYGAACLMKSQFEKRKVGTAAWLLREAT